MSDEQTVSHPVTVTVVYDGPAYAGKTTSVRALASGFGREATSPHPDEERTRYYDWLEYIGGRFAGSPIRCQVVSVPGQPELAGRRAYFIDRADVVVFVADTTRPCWESTVQRFHQLRTELAQRQPPVGIVFQANKRDASDAVPLPELEAAIGDATTIVFESVANTASGVREAFVFAIRLALDRVRAENHVEGTTRPGMELDHGPALIALLDRLGPDVSTRIALPSLPPIPTVPGEPKPLPTPEIMVPWKNVLGGLVWPPVEGRILLHEAAPLSGERVSVTRANDYYVGLGSGWRVHASASPEFSDLESARVGLIAWARKHTAAADTFSKKRCLVVSEVAPGRWRLWQLVRHIPSLRDRLEDDADRLDEATAEKLCAAIAPACAEHRLTCTFDTVGIDPTTTQPVFIGLAPPIEEAVA